MLAVLVPSTLIKFQLVEASLDKTGFCLTNMSISAHANKFLANPMQQQLAGLLVHSTS